jgi:ribosome biogenesis GTPase A
MTNINELDKKLKAEFESRFGENSVFNKKDLSQVFEKAKEFKKVLEQRKPIDTRFVSRFKVTLLKDNTIIINELKEEEARRLFDNIENAS